jgi:glucose-6-phosphate isomerase
MKRILLFLFLSIITFSLQAQYVQKAGVDSWRVLHNGKQKLKASSENSSKNVITITKADLKKTGALIITYKEMGGQKGWQRSITLFDEKDNELVKEESALLKVANTKLASLANTYKTIKVYSWALPTDPAVAATVRIRRVHLCTILIK